MPPVLLVEPQPPWLGCFCWYLWSSWPLLYWWLSESMEKRVASLLSCQLGACVCTACAPECQGVPSAPALAAVLVLVW